MFISLATIPGLLLRYRYALLFPIAVIEGPIISVLAGFFVSTGQMNFLAVFLIVVAGDIVGDAGWYALGRWGSRTMIPRYGHYVGLTPARIKKGEEVFARHPTGTLLFGKWSHTFGLGILVAAGITKQKFGKFLIVNSLGTVPKSLLLLIIGYYFGRAYLQINTYINDTAYIMLGIAALAVGVYFLFRHFGKKYMQ
jgi:membrane protein DedA with SNARE-associated domain